MLQVVFDAHTTDPKLNSRPLVVDVAPKSCTVTRNSYHEASTFQMEFDSRLLPFDPEAIASCAVRVYMWDSRGDEGLEWHVDDFEMLRGLTDDIGFRGGDGQKVTISGRDYQAALDAEWDPREQIISGVPIDVAIQHVADKAAPKGNQNRFLVVFRGTNDEGSPIPAPIIGAAQRSTKRKGLWVKPGKTYWEIIYEMATNNGFITYIDGSTIVIANPRTQTTDTLKVAPRVVYGKDLIWLEANRKLAKQKVPQIIIVYWDPVTKRAVDVTYPSKPREIVTGLGLKKNEDMFVPAPRGCIDRDTALRYAKMRWDLMARAESEYKFSTSHMRVERRLDSVVTPTSFGVGFVEEFDLLKLKAGDAIGIEFDPFNREHLRSLQIGERVEFIVGMGYAPAVARFIANNVDRITQFKQPYYTHKVTYTFDETEGLEIEIEGVNFASERREIAWADGAVPDAITGAG
jgi:hypothetical protein